MQEGFRVPFTLIALPVGGIIGLFLYISFMRGGFMADIMQAIFGHQPAHGWLQEFGFYLLLMLVTVVALAFVFLSELIDTAVAGDTGFKMDGPIGFFLAGASCGFPFFFIALGHANYAIFQANNGTFIGAILGLFGLLLMIPMSISALIFPLMALSTIVFGLICAPRVAIYYLTIHPLRDTVAEARRGERLSGASVISRLGRRSSSKTSAFSLEKQARDLLFEARQRKKELEAKKQALGLHVRDTKRFEIERQLSQTLREIEKLRVEVAELECKSKESGRYG